MHSERGRIKKLYGSWQHSPQIPNEGAQKQRLRATRAIIVRRRGHRCAEPQMPVNDSRVVARIVVGRCGGQKRLGATSVRNKISVTSRGMLNSRPNFCCTRRMRAEMRWAERMLSGSGQSGSTTQALGEDESNRKDQKDQSSEITDEANPNPSTTNLRCSMLGGTTRRRPEGRWIISMYAKEVKGCALHRVGTSVPVGRTSMTERTSSVDCSSKTGNIAS
ncbi:hypothetical protein EDB83DRAFT_388531 [Lactarius deliciosus]|nr:hypothetical protein EDB83DRAFT_388531 [Lactarius deliciosus]